MENTLNQFERLGNNLYRTGVGYWRLFAKGITPNGCWLIAPKMILLKDINIATGSDVFDSAELLFDACGTVPATYPYIKY